MVTKGTLLFFCIFEHVVKNKILYAPRRHRMITPIERYPSLGLKSSSWIHRSPGVIIVVTPLVSNRPLSALLSVELKLHQINCLFAKNVMIPNKIVYKPRWECVSFLSRALVHLGYALVNYLSSRQE
jgi:hypothetical protein